MGASCRSESSADGTDRTPSSVVYHTLCKGEDMNVYKSLVVPQRAIDHNSPSLFLDLLEEEVKEQARLS